jgi:hypothetical protein
MVQYYEDSALRRYQLDRRAAHSAPNVERRHAVANTVTSEQYAYLRDCLTKRERVKAILGNRERRARHLLYAATTGFIAYIFAAQDFTIDVQGISITARQIAAIFPLITAYLIVYACHTGATHLRVRYECKLLDLELQRFGCSTSGTILQKLREECSPTNPTVKTFLSTGAYYLVYGVHDMFLALSVGLALIGSAFIAVGIYRDLYDASQRVAVAFIVYLGVAGGSATLAPVCLRYARRKKQFALDNLLASVRPLSTP